MIANDNIATQGMKDNRIEHEVNVTGAFKNLISEERMFIKSYIQLWSSKNEPSVRSHVLSYDRPCYPKFDLKKEFTSSYLILIGIYSSAISVSRH